MKNIMELNHIYNMDCLEGMPQIPSGSIDMILCDLPYQVTRNAWDSMIPLEPLWEQYWRICKLSAAVVLTSVQPFTTTLIQSARRFFKYCWVWDKANSTSFLNAKKQPLRQTEDICVFYRKPPTCNPQMVSCGKPRTKGGYNKPGGSDNYGQFHATKTVSDIYYPTNLIRISNANRNDRLHPTQKPVALFEYLIRTYTNPGELVLDNCLGSGTSAVAALNTNRNYIGFELDPDYFKTAEQRIAKHREQVGQGPMIVPSCACILRVGAPNIVNMDLEDDRRYEAFKELMLTLAATELAA